MAVTQPELYLGVLQTDGVIAEAWRACIYMDSLDATFNATWYFTANNSWTSTIGLQSPLWLEVTGRVGGANAHDFDHVYTFTEYKPGSVPATELETPPGVYCENRINTKPLPNITDNFSYRTEIVDTATKYINFMSEYYYLQMRVSEYEYQPETGSPYGSNPIRRLHDFRTGVAYIMDTVLGNCTVTPISKLSADATAADSVHVRMKNEREFFSFNNKFTYAGQRVARDIDCDVWVSVKDDWPANQPFETHWEWYFATAAWLELAGYQYEALLPVMLRITAQAFDPPFERIYHIYDYREGELNNRDFDISTCFNKTHRVEYIVTFPGNYSIFVAPSLTDFRDQFLVTTTSICQVSYLRVARTRVDYDSNNIYVSFSLLDQAPIAGDVQQSEPEASLQEAGDRLQSAINNGYFLSRCQCKWSKDSTAQGY
ncbi:uncharacterized protein LOC112557987 [Pomacea canaliculata]|uniref:uncharacterized protein LOC112557987 n=1 Tax=Pomacea canaliculata TaxID=400727 RepID=UPI000D7278F3|nr:uncharacterized protein LOC112557987 [Pomacea canaliculata]